MLLSYPSEVEFGAVSGFGLANEEVRPVTVHVRVHVPLVHAALLELILQRSVAVRAELVSIVRRVLVVL